MTTAEPYAHLTSGSRRSKDDWSERLGRPLLEDMLALGALAVVERSELDGFEGLFAFPEGIQEGRLHVSQEVVLADPVEGGSSVRLDKSDLVFRAHPEKLIAKIAEVNRFSLCEAQPDQSPMVGCAERIIDRKRFKLLIVLDSTWLNSFGTRSMAEEIAKDAESLILLTDRKLPFFPWSLEGKIDRRAEIIPTSTDGWQIPREWFCHPRFGISAEAIVAEYPEKKFVYDGVGKKIFILSKQIVLKEESRPYNYLLGLREIIGSAVQIDYFANNYLKCFSGCLNTVVLNARNQAKRAIEKAITEKERLDLAMNLCFPDTPSNTVRSGFSEKDVLFLGL